MNGDRRHHPMPPRAALNLQTLRDLFGDDDEIIREILEAYADDLRLQSENLHAAANERDRTRFGRIAHSLKGASANVGAADFAGLCATVEKQSLGAPWDELEAAGREIAGGAAALCAVVREHITSL
jgi:HPt (histidine-containing phosphotransfer) domain-containing protein